MATQTIRLFSHFSGERVLDCKCEGTVIFAFTMLKECGNIWPTSGCGLYSELSACVGSPMTYITSGLNRA